jgi:thiamine-monophosphate kinase
MPAGAPRALGLTAIGRATGRVPARSGARAGNLLWVSGALGDAGAGLRILKGELGDSAFLVERYLYPRPRLEAGQRLAPFVTAMMDISDGLLIDALRMAEASGCAARIELESLPLSEAYLALLGESPEARLGAASAGDDYELLFGADEAAAAEILALADEIGLPFSRIGRFESGAGLSLTLRGAAVPLPSRLGFEHQG